MDKYLTFLFSFVKRSTQKMSYLTGSEAVQHLRGYIAQHLGLYDDEGVAQSKKKCHQHQRQSNCENIFPSSFAFALRVSLSLSQIMCRSVVALATLYLASGKSIN
jgi:hypothetical protein